jgi:3-methyl-2-oxobutanoate hydroxymethyltransferase
MTRPSPTPASQAGVEVLLVGDSLGMVLQGHDSTLPVTTAEMAYHTACVKRGNTALILADLPFMAHATEQALTNSATLMQAGAHMVKIEGAPGWPSRSACWPNAACRCARTWA